jgi:hypothetical protein
MRTYSYKEFRMEAEKDRTVAPDWLVEGVLPGSGLCLIVGDAYAGKTTFMACVLAAMAGPGQLAGRKVAAGRAIMTHLEHRRADLADLLERARRCHGLPEDGANVAIAEDVELANDSDIEELKKFADAEGAGLVVIDPLRRVAHEADLNSDKEAAHIMKELKRLDVRRRLVVVHHHLSRAGAVRGSSDLEAAVDTTIIVTRPRSSDVATLVVQHHNGRPPLTLKLRLVGDDATGIQLVDAGTTSGAAPVSLEDAIVRAVESKEDLSTSALVKVVANARGGKGRTHAEIKSAIAALAAAGRIENSAGAGGQGKAAKWRTCRPRAA